MTVQIEGQIGPFLDTVQQRHVPVMVVATCEYTAADPSANRAQLEQRVQAQLLRAIRDVTGPKMATEQLSFMLLHTGQVGFLIPEVIAASGLAQSGVRIDDLTMTFGIDGRAPTPPAVALQQQASRPAQASAPPGQPVRLRVGGFNVNASSGGGLDTSGLKNQLIDRVKSTLLWWAFGIGITLLVLVCLGGYGYYAYTHAPHAAGPPIVTASAPTPPPPTAPGKAGKPSKK
jgi:hypothetical protein